MAGDLCEPPCFFEVVVGLLCFALVEQGVGGEEVAAGLIEEGFLLLEGFEGFLEEAEGGFFIAGDEVQFGFLEEGVGVEVARFVAAGISACGLDMPIRVSPSTFEACEVAAQEMRRGGGGVG
jgi:hypothetical protein